MASGFVVLKLDIMLAVSGEAPGMDATHKEVKRHSRQEARNTFHLKRCTPTLLHTAEVSEWAGMTIPTT